MRRGLLAVLLAGCYDPRLPGSCALTCATPDDCPSGIGICKQGLCVAEMTDVCTPNDGGPDTPTSNCVGDPNGPPPFFEVCLDAPPDMTRSVSGKFDTGGTDCTKVRSATSGTDGKDVCVVAAQTVTVDGTLRAFGTRPLALVAFDVLVIDAEIDVAGHANDIRGTDPTNIDDAPAGAPGGAFACPRLFDGAATINKSSGGGAGGGFATNGGNGGNGFAASNGAMGNFELDDPVFRAGCDGSRGGPDVIGNDHALGGLGGGAVYLLAGTAIRFAAGGSGVVNASGGGADFGASHGGGGGGGSGGMIMLQAPAVENGDSAHLFALGGGGGGGADNGMGTFGDDPASESSGGNGGSGGGAGGNGGKGGFQAQLPAAGDNGTTGAGGDGAGGGGGGSVGRIRLRTPGFTGGGSNPPPS